MKSRNHYGNRKSTKYLVVKGVAGLGNRIVTLQKAVNYAKRTKRKLYVEWADGMFGNAGDNVFYKYFDLKNVEFIENDAAIEECLNDDDANEGTIYPAAFTLKEIREPIYSNYYCCTPSLARNYIYKRVMGFLFIHKSSYVAGCQSWQKYSNDGRNKDKKSWLQVVRHIFDKDNFPLGGNLSTLLREKIVIFADYRPYCKMNNISEYLRLSECVMTKIESFACENDLKDCAGVHVRNTDKKPGKTFDKLMCELTKKISTGMFRKIFLCTDSIEIVLLFKKSFADHLLMYPKHIPDVGGQNRSTHHWMRRNASGEEKERFFEAAIADIWLLSMTGMLYWQGNSSFGYISKILKNDSATTVDWLKL